MTVIDLFLINNYSFGIIVGDSVLLSKPIGEITLF